jgi:hypothetical protein
MKYIFFLFLGTLLFIINSCTKNNPDPSWLEVTKWTLNANPNLTGLEGSLTQNISEAWVYVDDEIIGVFEVPFKIPILKEGSVNIKIYPAIKNNGISATKKVYPFLEPYVVTGNLVKNQTLTLNPITQYYNAVQFWIEDFEDAAVKIENDPNSAAQITTGNDPLILQSFNGNNYGKVVLNSVDTTWIGYTNVEMNLPRSAEVYLEIDYYNTNAVITGLLAVSPSGVQPNPNIQLNAQSPSSVKWKKIYIDLRELVSNSNPSAYFEQSFQAELDEGDSEGVIIIDNIKVVHF